MNAKISKIGRAASLASLAVLGWSASAAADPVCGAQCAEPASPSVDCSSECDRDLDGGGNENINPGEVVCVQPGDNYTGGINMNGGELRVCGSTTPSYFNLNAGDVTILGEASFSWVNMNNASSTVTNYGELAVQGLGGQGTLENHGSASVQYDLNLNSGASVYNTGTLALAQSLNNGATVYNAGTLSINSNLQNNGGGEFTNACTATVAGNANLGGSATNLGSLTVDGALSVNQQLSLGADSELQCGSLYVNGSVDGPDESCSAVAVSNTTVVNGSVSGSVDVCDANGIESGSNKLGGEVTTDCSCDPTASCANVTTLYWADSDLGVVESAGIDGSDRGVLVSQEFGDTTRLSIDPVRGHIYWVSTDAGVINRANLDGSDVVEIVAVPDFTSDVEVDLVNERLFWTSPAEGLIQSSTLDGTNVLTHAEGPRWWSIAVDGAERVLYGTATFDERIGKLDLNTGLASTILGPSDGVSLPLDLGFDVVSQKLYWVDDDSSVVRRAGVDGSDIEDLIADADEVEALVVSAEMGLVCWSDVALDELYCGDLDMQDATLVADDGMSSVTGLALVAP